MHNIKQGNIMIKILLPIILVLLIGLIGYQFINKTSKTDSNQKLEKFSNTNTETETKDTYIDWNTLTNDETGISIRYPSNLKDILQSKDFTLIATSKQELIDKYNSYSQTGCPSNCGLLASDPTFLQKQFDILNELNTFKDCVLPQSYKQQVKENFVLFTGGISSKKDVSGIPLSDGKCALRVIETDGYDVSLFNYYYKVSFMVQDKVYNIGFKIFPQTDGIKSVDTLKSEIGFEDGSCDAECYTKEIEYFFKVNMEDPILKEVVSLYDNVIKSIKY